LGAPGTGSITPVHSRPKRLFWVSAGSRGLIWMISRADSVLSTRERTKPSVGERAMRWKRSRGSLERASTRSMSPNA
jgi:hypothetical protein